MRSCWLKTAILVLLLGLGGTAAKVWRVHAGLPPELLAGARIWPIDELGSHRLWLADDEQDVLLRAAEVRLTNGGRERRVFLQYPDASTRYLGALTYQLPDTPIATLFMRVGDNIYIIGSVDDAVPHDRHIVTLSRPGPAHTPAAPARVHTRARDGLFFAHVPNDAAHLWSSLDVIKLESAQSLNTVPPSAYHNGAALLPLTDARGSDWYRQFQPPASIANLFVTLDMPSIAIQP